jgi:hypothetical protein
MWVALTFPVVVTTCVIGTVVAFLIRLPKAAITTIVTFPSVNITGGAVEASLTCASIALRMFSVVHARLACGTVAVGTVGLALPGREGKE